jgi:chemotaxis protein histidine kinase CheA
MESNSQTRKEASTIPVANKTRKRCPRGQWYVPSRDICMSKEDAMRIMDAEKAQAKAAKALNQAEAKVAKKAAKVKLKGMQVEMKSDIPEEVTLLEESEKKEHEVKMATTETKESQPKEQEQEQESEGHESQPKEQEQEQEQEQEKEREGHESQPKEQEQEQEQEKEREGHESQPKEQESEIKDPLEDPNPDGAERREPNTVLEFAPFQSPVEPEKFEKKEETSKTPEESKKPGILSSAAAFFSTLTSKKESTKSSEESQSDSESESETETETEKSENPESGIEDKEVETLAKKVDMVEIDDEVESLEEEGEGDIDEDDENYHKSLTHGDDHFHDESNMDKFVNEREVYLDMAQEIPDDEKSGFLFPRLDDPHFNSKLAAKREFRDLKYDGDIDKDITKKAERACQSDFELLPHQQFVKNFMSLETPYNSLLLYHELGTGKTCSAIGITEEMRSYMKDTNVLKKIMIVASPNVQDNFRNQLFNPSKLEKLSNGGWDLHTCVGPYLLREINPAQVKGLSREQVVKSIQTLIKKYYRFLGYDSMALYSHSEMKNVERREKRKRKQEGILPTDTSFADHVENELPEILDLKPIKASDSAETKAKKKKVIQKLREKFDYRLIVVDEFHNMVARQRNSKNNAVRILQRIVQYCKYTRLVLLSATPLYNSQEEIIPVVNILNMNDKRAVITEDQVFDKKGNFVKEMKNANGVVIQESGDDLLRRKLTGYVSYVRGENPYTFPYRIYPKEFADKPHLMSSYSYPSLQFNGAAMTYSPKKYILENVFVNTVGEYQTHVYQTILTHMKKTIPEFNTKTRFNFEELTTPLSVLNVVYPSANMDNALEQKQEYNASLNVLHGKGGLKNAMDYEEISHPHEQLANFEYKPDILAKHGRFFQLDKIGKFSGKIESICKAILNSTGIVLIYSRYLHGGLLPMALALEEMGFSRYCYSSHVNSFLKTPQPALDALTMKPKTAKSKFTAKYAMITGTKLFSPNNDLDLSLITDKSNSDGSHVKVVMISEAGSEGLDFKCIRQVHILDPWYNMSRIEQTIGRAVRNKSHCSLPLAQRNVEIYMHGSMASKEPTIELPDLYMYRLAEYKAIQIGNITRILKESSVDCLLNESQNNFTEGHLGTTIQLKLSSGQKKIEYKVGDKAFSSKCDYMEQCELSCKPGKVAIASDNTTYTLHHMSQNHEQLRKRIQQLYKERAFYTLKEIIREIQVHKTYPIEDVYYSLSRFLKHDTELLVHKGTVGHLTLHEDVYSFQPNAISDTHASVFERTTPMYEKPRHVVIEKEETPDDFLPSLHDASKRSKTIVLTAPEKELVPPNTLTEEQTSALGKPIIRKQKTPAKTHSQMWKKLSETLTFWNRPIDKYIDEYGTSTKSKEMTHLGIRIIHILNTVHRMPIEKTTTHLLYHLLDFTGFEEKMNYVNELFKGPDDFQKAEEYLRNDAFTRPTNSTTMEYLESMVYSYFYRRMYHVSRNQKSYWVLCLRHGSETVLLVFKKDKWELATPTEKEEESTEAWLQKTFNKQEMVLTKVRKEFEKNENDRESILGFIGLSKSGKEKDGYELKLKNILKSRNASGATCDQASKDITSGRFESLCQYLDESTKAYKRDQAKDYVEIGGKNLYFIKTHLCLLYEIFLREMEFSGKHGKWFLGPEESIYTDIGHLTVEKVSTKHHVDFHLVTKK